MAEGASLAAERRGDVPAHWREALAARLGQRPRRLGLWAELALWGARLCLDAAGEPQLPQGAGLLVTSLSGPAEALREGVQALHQQGLPAPFTFLQAQPLVGLASIACRLHEGPWRGNALALNARDDAAAAALVRAWARHAPVLHGRVESGTALRSDWWYWRAPRQSDQPA